MSGFNGEISVDWTNPSGTEVIGSWNTVVQIPHGESVANYEAVIDNGRVKPFPRALDPLVAW